VSCNFNLVTAAKPPFLQRFIPPACTALLIAISLSLDIPSIHLFILLSSFFISLSFFFFSRPSSVVFYASFEDHFLHRFTYCSHFVCYYISSPPCHFLARSLLPRTLFVGAFAKLRKATISFVMSVRPSAWNNLTPTGRIFIIFDI